MALEFKIEVKIDGSGNPIYQTDKTGAYDVTDNEGGWGAPNPERNLNALMAIVEKIVHEDGQPNTFLTPLTNQIVYNPSIDNSYETAFQFQIGNDGGHIHHFLLLPVSTDGITTLEGNTIQENEYFYMTDGFVYQKELGGNNVVVDDYSVLVDPANLNKPVQANCQKLWSPQLNIKEGTIYNEYRIARENCDDQREMLLDGIELGYNVKHANGLFYQGLQLEAEDVIETQLEKYGL